MENSSDVQVAQEKFLTGYNCAQAVLYAACDQLHVDKDIALKMACGFGAGMGREQEVCGAVSGGILAIGLKHGRGEGETRSKTDDTYARVRAFMDAFRDRHGSVVCRELLGCDLRTPEGQRYFKDNDLIRQTCARCVQTATELMRSHLA